MKFQRAEWRRLNPTPSIASATTGAIAELYVAIDLMRKGYEVFRALSPASSCDLAILKERALVRVEVRTGYRNKSGKVSCSWNESDGPRHDVLAIVLLKELAVIYRPELPLQAHPSTRTVEP